MNPIISPYYNPYSDKVAVSATLHALLAKASKVLPSWKQRIAQRAALAELDSRLLADAGISEQQRLAEISKPCWRT